MNEFMVWVLLLLLIGLVGVAVGWWLRSLEPLDGDLLKCGRCGETVALLKNDEQVAA
jgi:hypothetical protein